VRFVPHMRGCSERIEEIRSAVSMVVGVFAPGSLFTGFKNTQQETKA
jgi:hypothetical protein